MRHFASATVLAAILFPAAVAAADPSTTAAAPQTHDWSEVSHINGQLVPVGESNSYLKKFRRTNISTNPVGWLAGFYGVSASYGINEHIAIKADANVYHHIFDSDTNGTEFSVSAPLFLRRTYQGAYLEPGIVARTMSSENDGCYTYDAQGQCETSKTTAGPEMLVGWQWTWDSGLNVAAAAGIGRDLNSNDAGDESIFFNGYFRVGYAF